MYGNATLWCWLSSQWDEVRIYTLYGPVWYVHTVMGKSLILTSNRVIILLTTTIYLRAGREIYIKRKQLREFNVPSSPEPLPPMGDPFQSAKTTEVVVTSEEIENPNESTEHRYTVTVSSSQPNVLDKIGFWDSEKATPQQCEQRDSVVNSPASAQAPGYDPASLFPPRRYAAMESNNAAWSYTKVAVLFFVAMMVTWMPSSANRVYSVVHKGETSMALEFASAFVLPLQGFWNALIYATTSLPACRQAWARIRGRHRLSGDLSDSGNDSSQNQCRKQYTIDTDSTTDLNFRPETESSSC